MCEETLKDAERFARQLVRNIFNQSDKDFLVSSFSDNIIWSGVEEKQRVEGKKEVVLKIIDREKTDECYKEKYYTTSISETVYLCEATVHL